MPEAPLPFSRALGRASARVASLALLFACLGGCGSKECAKLSVCDVAGHSCQTQIMEVVSCLRGGEAPLPPVKVVSESELVEALTPSAEADPEETRRSALWFKGLSFYSLGQADYSEESSRADWASQIAAVYLPSSKEIMVVDRGEGLVSEQAVTTFAHEVVHALQDADYDLGAFNQRWARDYDSALAVDAIIEGEAMLYENLLSLQFADLRQDEVDWEAYFTKWRAESLKEAEQDDDPYLMADVRFPYAFGGGLVMQYFLEGGRAAVDSLIANPPVTTREVMFGVESGAGATAEVAGTDFWQHALPDLGDSFELVSGTSLGAWMTRVFAARMGVPVPNRLDASEAMLADAFVVQEERATGQLVASWRIRLDDTEITFPGLGSARFQSWREDTDSLFFASRMFLGNAQSLAWQSYDDADSNDDAEAAASISSSTWSHHRSWKRSARGCDVHAPPLKVTR